MVKTAGHILKSEDVKLEGRFRLDLKQPVSAEDGPIGTKAPLAAPQARIAEKQSDFAVIEIVCSCAKKTYLKCEYSSAPVPEAANNQNGELAATEQAPDRKEQQ